MATLSLVDRSDRQMDRWTDIQTDRHIKYFSLKSNPSRVTLSIQVVDVLRCGGSQSIKDHSDSTKQKLLKITQNKLG